MFKEKGPLIVKYIVNQIAMSLFGFMMATTAMMLGDSWLLPFGIFALLFYLFILITFIREDGQKDAIKIESGRMKRDSFSALKYCSVAAIPGFIIALINVILSFSAAQTGFVAVCSAVFNVITRIFVYGMYNPIDSYLFNHEIGIFSFAEFISSSGISYLLYTFVTLFVCHITYCISTRNSSKK